MTPRLGVNIDHVATLRQQRDEGYPNLENAADICLKAGADQITIHLREDRRHIQDADVAAVKKVTAIHSKPLNLEIGCAPEIVEIAISTNPEWVCLVPEKREEKTTEGGLNLKDQNNFERVLKTCEKIKKETKGTKISLFLEANPDILQKAAELPIEAVEIHTGDFARAALEGESVDKYFDLFSSAKRFLLENNIACHAGHGLTGDSVKPLLEKELFEEYNIGHWIISDAVFYGLEKVVNKLKKEFEGFSYESC